VQQFFRYQVEQARNSGSSDDVAKMQTLALRASLNATGFQGDMLAAVIDRDGHAILLGGVFKEAATKAMSVTLPDGTAAEADYVGADLYTGFTVVKLSSAKGITPTMWPKSKIQHGQMLLPVTGGQTFAPMVFAQARVGEQFSEDRMPADEQSNPRFERSGAFLFNVDGNLAAVVTTGGSWAVGERLALSAARLQREINYIITQKKDVEPRPLGVKFEQKTVSGRQLQQVSDVTAGSLAQSAGVQKGDYLVAIDGRPMIKLVAGTYALPSMTQLQVDLQTRTGDVPVEVLRDGKEMTLQMHLGGN